MNLCIADNLKLLRYQHSYTLEAIAEIISVSRQSVAKWEAGDSIPDVINCVKLASLYKITLDELVNKPLQKAILHDIDSETGRICGIVEISPKKHHPRPGFRYGAVRYAQRGQGAAVG